MTKSNAVKASLASLPTVRVALDTLTADPINARTHGEKNLGAILGSLTQFGQVEALVVQKGTGRVIGGNGRLEAMRQMGWTHADVVEVDISDEKATALALALNRTGELAGWDFERLAEQTGVLKEAGFDLASIGWTEDDLSPIWAADWVPPAEEPLEDHQRSDPHEHAHSVRLTIEQREVFNKAAFKAREDSGDHEMTDGRALELICGDYLAGA